MENVKGKQVYALLYLLTIALSMWDAETLGVCAVHASVHQQPCGVRVSLSLSTEARG